MSGRSPSKGRKTMRLADPAASICDFDRDAFSPRRSSHSPREPVGLALWAMPPGACESLTTCTGMARTGNAACTGHSDRPRPSRQRLTALRAFRAPSGITGSRAGMAQRASPTVQKSRDVRRHHFLLHPAHQAGTVTTMRVPCPGELSITTLPPSNSARSLMPTRPKLRRCPPGGDPVRKPTPSSSTVRRTVRGSKPSVTSIRAGLACLLALVIASCPTRKRLFSTTGARRRLAPSIYIFGFTPVPSVVWTRIPSNACPRSRCSRTCERMFQIESRASVKAARASLCATPR